MSSPRPKIEVVRVSSFEQAKMRPLLEGGIQLRAEFKHLRCGDYASYQSLEWGRDCYRFDVEDHGTGKPQHSYTAPPLSTKSCDNIFARQVACERDGERRLVGSPYLWRDATRSEEMLYCTPHRHQHQHTSCCRSTGNVAQATSARSRLTALLKKLSPRLRRPAPKTATCPWVLVEFSSHDLEQTTTEGRDCSRDSATSDRSFDIAVREAMLRKEKAKLSQQPCKNSSVTATSTTTLTASRPPLVPPQILIGTPETSPRNIQRSVPVSPQQTTSLSSKPHHSRPTRGSQQRPEPSHAVASRPHTLLIQPPVRAATSLSPADILRLQPLTCKMASFESIGSCSLDAYATASEASETTEDETASARTLHSVPVGLSPVVEPSKVGSGASSPEYVKRTARLFETSPAKVTPNIIVENGGAKDSLVNGGTTGKKPSYLGLACSISGYSGITTYDSKLREGFRSRDHSPGRLGLIRSRDTSPLRPDLAADSLTCFKSDCGNFLTAQSKTTAPTLDKSPLKLSTVQKTSNDIRPLVNGATARAKHYMNGTMEETRKPEGHQINGTSEMAVKESFSESTSSHIRESSRNFMSSMLSDTFDSTRTKELFGVSTPVNKTATSSESQEGFVITSPVKPSPDSSKSVSKDSLSPASGTSPQKRSPGAVRVVEFTSQTKSYVKTVISSRTFLHSSSSVDSPFTNLADTSLPDIGCQHPVYSSSSSVSENVNSTANGSINKSFIQQRVERLYGPGALAQGFFRRTRLLSKTNDESQEVDASPSTRIHSTAVSSPGLPVLRHLRPEFRAQLPLTTTARRRQDEENVETEKISSVEPMVLQTQVSVESVAESLPDMQPAAPEVVLPVETQPIMDCPKTPEQEHKLEAGDSSNEKDAHYFLKLLKQEIDRLSVLVAWAEQELDIGKDLPEEALGKLRAASGQARLLTKQKLQQFEGLCHKNISQSPQETFPTTSQDLAGFWDMVKLQVDHVDRLFDELRILRQSNWIEQEPAISSDTVDTGSTSSGGPKRRSASKRIVSKPIASEEQKKASEAARKTREELRRKMMEERRKAMRQKATTDDIKIYVPQENGK